MRNDEMIDNSSIINKEWIDNNQLIKHPIDNEENKTNDEKRNDEMIDNSSNKDPIDTNRFVKHHIGNGENNKAKKNAKKRKKKVLRKKRKNVLKIHINKIRETLNSSALVSVRSAVYGRL